MRVLVAVGLSLGVGCGSVSGSTDAAVHADAARDAPGPDAPPPPCDLTKPFGTPVAAPGINTNSTDEWGWFSPDLLTVYFTSAATGSSNLDIYTATRALPTSSFSTPVLLAGVNTADIEDRPVVTADGLTLFAHSAVAGGNVHIAVATRTSATATFGALSPVGVINSNAVDADPWISDDGLTIYFASTRGGNFEIYRATRANASAAFGTPAVVPELSSTAVDDAPVVSKDGLEIYFASTRGATGGNPRNDIWHATRSTTTDGFGTPTLVSELSTTASEDFPSWLSPDRCTLMYTTDAAGGQGGYDIWIARRPL